MTQAVCSVPRCPHPARDRGYCVNHRQTTSERGYGIDHQRERKAALPGASCEACGCTRDLQRDHRDPTIKGPAREAPANKRWLCDCPAHRCHSRLGMKSTRRGMGVEISARVGDQKTCDPNLRDVRNSEMDKSPMRVIG